MKKKLFACLLALLMLVIFTGCSNKNPLVGKWLTTSFLYNGSEIDIGDEKFYFVFKEDKMAMGYEEDIDSEDDYYAYTYDTKAKTITVVDGVEDVVIKYSLSGKKLSITIDMSGLTVTYICEKQ